MARCPAGLLARLCLPAELGPGRSCSGCCGCFGKANYNVVLMVIMCVLYGLAESIWTGTVIVSFIYILSGDSNSMVGYIEAAQGMASLALALPVGYLADRYSRSAVISGGAAASMVAIGATVYATWKGAEGQGDWHHHYIILLVAMCFWGVVGGIANGPAQALYADSIPQGQRSQYYQYLFVAWGLSSVTGPIIAIAIFAVYGDHWDLRRLRTVILAGMACEFCAAISMSMFRDDAALPEDEQDDEADDSDDGSGARRGAALEAGGSFRRDDPIATKKRPELQRAVTDQFLDEVSICNGCLTRRSVPWILFICDLVTALGSGMTVKFFPLFFKNDVGMSPIQVQAIFAVCPLAMVLFAWLATSLKDHIGRMQTIILFRVIGVGLLATMAVLASGVTTNRYILVPIYVVRTGMMNCTYPLDESILMDFCPKKERARWKSLESISAFGWCGSAVLGGILGDKHGYSYTFFITAVVQGAAVFGNALLLPLVPRKELSKGDMRDRLMNQAAKNDSKREDMGASRPLLDGAAGDDYKQARVGAFPDEIGGVQ